MGGLSDRCRLLEAVIKLGDSNKSTLGFMPRGAFEANQRTIVVASLPDDSALAGYLMYRVNRRSETAVIAHLCVDKRFRGEGVARALFDELKQRARHLSSIRVRCRNDYEENDVWPQLGFRRAGDAVGRGRDRKPLTIWRYHISGSSLFDGVDAQQVLPVAAIDAQVFYDFVRVSSDSHESEALLEDWLSDFIKLSLTPEIDVEISRGRDKGRRKHHEARARDFEVTEGDGADFDKALKRVQGLIGPGRTRNDHSDRRHIAHVVAGGAKFFATRDEAVLKWREEIDREFGVKVLRPSELIATIDRAGNEADYEPARFESSLMRVARPSQLDESVHVSPFLRTDLGEKKYELRRAITGLLSSARTARLQQISDARGSPIMLVGWRGIGSRSLDVTVFRVSSSPLAPTVARRAVMGLISTMGSHVVQVTDSKLCHSSVAALRDAGFSRSERSWWKCLVHESNFASSIAQSARSMLQEASPPVAAMTEMDNDPSLQMEKTYWPCKLRDLSIDNWIVPIQSRWAESMFETRLGADSLFGVPPELAFALENVYYRSARTGIKAPARLLWYVSRGPRSIRAASLLEDVQIDKPSVLFKQFKRLGVYSWEQVLETAHGDEGALIMACRFSHTELLRPVDFGEVQCILENHGCSRNNLQSPLQISSEIFFDLYQRA